MWFEWNLLFSFLNFPAWGSSRLEQCCPIKLSAMTNVMFVLFNMALLTTWNVAKVTKSQTISINHRFRVCSNFCFQWLLYGQLISSGSLISSSRPQRYLEGLWKQISPGLYSQFLSLVQMKLKNLVFSEKFSKYARFTATFEETTWPEKFKPLFLLNTSSMYRYLYLHRFLFHSTWF